MVVRMKVAMKRRERPAHMMPRVVMTSEKIDMEMGRDIKRQ